MIATDLSRDFTLAMTWDQAVAEFPVLSSIQFLLLYIAREDPVRVEVSASSDLFLFWSNCPFLPTLLIKDGVFCLPQFGKSGTIERVMHTNDLDYVFLDDDFGLLWKLPLRAEHF